MILKTMRIRYIPTPGYGCSDVYESKIPEEPGNQGTWWVSVSGLYDRGGAAGKLFASVGWLSDEDDLACYINLTER